jgi:DNA mismatch repair protein MutH
VSGGNKPACAATKADEIAINKIAAKAINTLARGMFLRKKLNFTT